MMNFRGCGVFLMLVGFCYSCEDNPLTGKLRGRTTNSFSATSWQECCTQCSQSSEGCAAWRYDVDSEVCDFFDSRSNNVTPSESYFYGFVEFESGTSPPESPISENCTRARLSLSEVNALIFQITVSFSSTRSSVYVEYEAENNSQAPKLRSETTTSTERVQRLFMVRLYANTDYRYKVFDAQENCVIGEGTFRSGALPPELVARNPTRVEGTGSFGILFSACRECNTYYAFDEQGEVVWYHQSNDIQKSTHFLLDRESHNIILNTWENEFSPSVIVELSPTGRVMNRFEMECTQVHHDWGWGEGGIWTLSTERYNVPGLDYDQISDTVLILDHKKETWQQQFDMFDMLDVLQQRTRSSNKTSPANEHKPCDNNEEVNDWLHSDSVHESDGEVVVCARNTNGLYVLHRGSDGEWELKYGIDDFSEYRFLDASDKFFGQHGCRLRENGNIILFDNGPNRKNSDIQFSRAMEISVNEGLKTVRKVWEYQLILGENGPCFARAHGNVEETQNGHFVSLFTQCSNDNDDFTFFVETDSNGDLVALYRETLQENLDFVEDFYFRDSVFGEIVV